MTSHVGRLYALAAAFATFFVLWAVIAAKPWQQARAADARLAALDQRAQTLRRQEALVREIVRRRSAARDTASPDGSIAPAPARIVSLPPLVVSRTS